MKMLLREARKVGIPSRTGEGQNVGRLSGFTYTAVSQDLYLEPKTHTQVIVITTLKHNRYAGAQCLVVNSLLFIVYENCVVSVVS